MYKVYTIKCGNMRPRAPDGYTAEHACVQTTIMLPKYIRDRMQAEGVNISEWVRERMRAEYLETHQERAVYLQGLLQKELRALEEENALSQSASAVQSFIRTGINDAWRNLGLMPSRDEQGAAYKDFCVALDKVLHDLPADIRGKMTMMALKVRDAWWRQVAKEHGVLL